MNRRVFTILCCCFFLALPAISLGTTGMYGSFNAGVALPADGDLSVDMIALEMAYDTTSTVGGAIGYMAENFRFEGEVAYQNNEVDGIGGLTLPIVIDGDRLSSMEVSVLTFLLNGYMDFDTGAEITPFITAGFGVASIEGEMTVNGLKGDEDDTVFAYQLGVGAGFAVAHTAQRRHHRTNYRLHAGLRCATGYRNGAATARH